jgi:ABC-type polysaccharide transport system permease subunit
MTDQIAARTDDIAARTSEIAARRKIRWHIPVFLAPAVLVYTALMIVPLFSTLKLSLYKDIDQQQVFVGLDNFRTLFGDPRWSKDFWNALGNNLWFFFIHMLLQNPIGIGLAALLSSPRLRMSAFYRTAIFIPTILSFVIVGFGWKLILSPIWGIAPSMLDAIGLKSLFAPWLGQERTALTTLSLISVWQFVGIPMMLIYAAHPALDRHHLGADVRRQFQRLRPDLFRARGARRTELRDGHSWHLPLSHLLRLPVADRQSEHGISDCLRHADDHSHRRLDLSLRRADASASVSALGVPR